MTPEIAVYSAALARVASKLDEAAGQLGAAFERVRQAEATHGECWGNDKSGRQFGDGPEGYKAGSENLGDVAQSHVEFLSGGEGLSQAVRNTVETFQNTEYHNGQIIRRSGSSLS